MQQKTMLNTSRKFTATLGVCRYLMHVVTLFARAGRHERQSSELTLLPHMQPGKGKEGKLPDCTPLMYIWPAVDVEGFLSCRHACEFDELACIELLLLALSWSHDIEQTVGPRTLNQQTKNKQNT